MSKKSTNKVTEVGGFTILGRVEEETVIKVQRVLPVWLTTPVVISTKIRDGKKDITEFPMLDSMLVNNVIENKITHLFPVQSMVIPWILQNDSSFCRARDICVSAPTGSGKTLAYVLPIVQCVRKRVVTAVRALVVLPVRDLALQVYEVFMMCCKKTGIKIALLDGEKKFLDEQALLVRPSGSGYQVLVDIVVATPGRLVDHITKTEGFCLKQLKFLVLDEADRMMEEIKQDWLQILEQRLESYCNDVKIPHLPGIARVHNGSFTSSVMPFNMNCWHAKPQKLLFSATLSQNPEKLQQLNLFQPKLFTSVIQEEESKDVKEIQYRFIGKYTTPSELQEYYITCERDLKPLMLYYLLEHHSFRRVLCFTNSVETTTRLATLMRKMTTLSIRHVSSKLSVTARTKFLEEFKNKKIDLIICTDLYGRGMDIQGVKYVVSYDIPANLKRYIHRIGRTARAGKKGTAVALLLKHEIAHFQSFMTSSRKNHVCELSINKDMFDSYKQRYEMSLANLKGGSE